MAAKKQPDGAVVLTAQESELLTLYLITGMVLSSVLLVFPWIINFFTMPFGNVGGRARSIITMFAGGALTWLTLKKSNGNRKLQAVGAGFAGVTVYSAWNALGYSDVNGGALAKNYALNLPPEGEEKTSDMA